MAKEKFLGGGGKKGLASMEHHCPLNSILPFLSGTSTLRHWSNPPKSFIVPSSIPEGGFDVASITNLRLRKERKNHFIAH